MLDIHRRDGVLLTMASLADATRVAKGTPSNNSLGQALLRGEVAESIAIRTVGGYLWPMETRPAAW